MRRTTYLIAPLAVLAMAVSAPSLAADRDNEASSAPPRLSPIVLDAGGVRVRVVPVADGLVWPWDLAFLPEGHAMLVTEAPGRLRLVRDDILVREPVWQLAAPAGNDVLHGLVLHPNFAENRYVYLSYAKGGRRGVTLAIARGRLEADRLVDVQEIFIADAWADALHNTAGRIVFGSDGMLYVSVGDRDRLWVTDDRHLRLRAQDLSNHVGKILRLTDEGGVPDDNPILGRRGVKPEIFAYGFRNGYGLAFHPRTGELWQADIGPLGGDEINIVKPGGNYGWPLVSSGRHYSGTPVLEQSHRAPSEVTAPAVSWVPAITPSSIAFYTGDEFPEWQGSAFVSALSGRQVQRISFHESGGIEREPLLTELELRFRVVAQGPDGYLYVATETQYGSGKPDGEILRIEPQ